MKKILILLAALLFASPSFAASVRSITCTGGLTNTPGQTGTPITTTGKCYSQTPTQEFTGSTTIPSSLSAGTSVFAPVNGTDTGTFTLSQANSTGFEQWTQYTFFNGSSGNLTITNQSVSCSGSCSVFKDVPLTGGNIVLGQYGSATCNSNAGNWNCAINSVSSGGSVSVTAANAGIVITPSPGTGTFTVGTTAVINNQGTATSYTVLSTDNPKIIEFTGGSSAVAVTLPNANSAGFTAGFATSIQNFDTANVTITPTTSTINGAATLILYPGEEADIVSDGTNYIADVKKVPIQFFSFQPGSMTTIVSSKGVFYKASKNLTVDNITGSAISFTCTGNPVITLYECGTSTTCASPTTIGSVTVTANSTATVGAVSAGAITAGDYVGWAISSGTCTLLDISATAQAHQN